jgi:hypothetical protein
MLSRVKHCTRFQESSGALISSLLLLPCDSLCDYGHLLVIEVTPAVARRHISGDKRAPFLVMEPSGSIARC